LAYFQDAGCSPAVCNGETNTQARTALRPFGPLTLDNGMNYYSRSGQANYNSLQSSFNMHFTRNSIFQVAYTWSKLISDTQFIDSPAYNVDFYNPRANRGPDLLNRPQILVFNLIYNLPTLQSQNAFVRTGFGSWEVSTITNLASGPSLTPVIGGDYLGVGDSGQQRPMLVPGQSCRQHGDANGRQWLNPNAFTLNGLQIGSIGTSGVGFCQGPGNSDVDFSLRKNFKLREWLKMQFQLDFFNVFNHPQYQASAMNMNWGYNTPTRTVGVASSALYADKNGAPIFPSAAGLTGCNGTTHLASAAGADGEQLCAASIINTTYNPGSNFGLATQSRENGWRQIQYGLKFTF
jgi:hypothetical protein